MTFAEPAQATASKPARDVSAVIAAVGMALPARRVQNAEIAGRLGVAESWIAKRTGTSERRWAEPGERVSELAAQAGRDALGHAGLEAGELDLVLVATTTPDELSPNAAPLVAGLVGARRAAAFDLGAACTGWLAAIAVACGQIESGRARHALVIGAELLSRFLDPSDRDTAPLFADGAGAAVVSAADGLASAIGPVILGADDAGAHLIRLARGDAIRMRGPDTFRVAVAKLSEVTLQAVERAGLELADIDLFVFHQANSRIIRAVGDRLRLSRERTVDYVDRFANTSTATLPIALCTARDEGRLRRGDRVLLAAFGAGLTWGATVVQWCQ